MTPIEKKVLSAAVDSGGVVELTGVDKYPGANGHWVNAATRLYGIGHLVYAPLRHHGIGWRITDAGRAVLKEAA